MKNSPLPVFDAHKQTPGSRSLLHYLLLLRLHRQDRWLSLDSLLRNYMGH
jgi:hypothetical protein